MSFSSHCLYTYLLMQADIPLLFEALQILRNLCIFVERTSTYHTVGKPAG